MSEKLKSILIPIVFLLLNTSLVRSFDDGPHAWRQVAGQPVSGYNETCSENSTKEGSEHKNEDALPCDTNKNLTCTVDKICDCKQDPDTLLIFAYDINSKACSPISQQARAASVDLSSSRCLTHTQCRESILGPLSRCADYGHTSRCECYDTLTNGNKPVVLVNRRCQYIQNYGDVCETDHECNGTITGEAICKQENPNFDRKICVCHFDYTWDNKLQECVKIADTGLDFTCRSDLQCSHPNALGPLSRCDSNSRKCECFDLDSNGKVDTGVHPVTGKCLLKRRINETCQNIEECKLGSSHLAVCKEFDIYNSTKICQCREGYVWGQTHEYGKEDCLTLGKYHDSCTADQQCYHPNALGELSTCAPVSGSNNPRMGHCECWDTRQHGEQETGFYQGKCYFKRRANETCETLEECIVGFHGNAICSEHPSFYAQKVCTCPEDKTCSAPGVFSSAGFTLSVLVSTYLYAKYI